MKLAMKRIVAAAAVVFCAAAAHASDLELFTSAMHLLGTARIQGTDDHLHSRTAFGPAVSISIEVREHWLISAGASTALVPMTVHESGGRYVARPLRATPVHVTLLARGDEALIEPYFGAGISYLAIRDSHVVSAPEMHILHIANPDHPALLVEGGVRVRTNARLSLVGDVKFGPAASTLETFTREVRNNGLQTNVHPLVVSTGVALHF